MHTSHDWCLLSANGQRQPRHEHPTEEPFVGAGLPDQFAVGHQFTHRAVVRSTNGKWGAGGGGQRSQVTQLALPRRQPQQVWSLSIIIVSRQLL